MRAMVVTAFGGPEVLQPREVEAPRPGPGQVQIQVAATSVNFADILARRGLYHGGAQAPFVPGLDAAGTIAALGEGVAGWQVGQRVAGMLSGGTYAELAVADPVSLFALPDSVDWETAAAFPVLGVTAYNILHLAGRLAAGETVLVHAAAGGVGTTAVQMARLLGAGQVIGTVGDDAKAALVRELGADAAINYRTADLAARVLELTDGRGVDVILDSVSGEVFRESLRCLAQFGRIVVFGRSSGQAGTVQTTELDGVNRAVIGYSSGHYRRNRPAALRPAGETVLGWLAEGRWRPIIGHRYPLAEAAAAQQLIERRASTGKVLLLP